VRELPRPRATAPGEAIALRVDVAAICGSDLHPYRGAEKGLAPGTVMGHEFVGHVVEVGPDTHGLAVGDRVVAPFTTNCGACYFCTHHLSCRCKSGQLFGWVDESTGAGLQGAQAEYVRVPLAQSTLMPVPAHLPSDRAILLGDILATGFFCALRGGICDAAALHAASAASGTSGTATNSDPLMVVVIGCGPVGLMAVASAAYLGAKSGRPTTVVAVDAVPERMAAAKRLGAKHVFSFRTDNVVERVAELSPSQTGADVVLEVVGQPAAMKLAYDCMRPGGVLSSVGVHAYEHNQISPEGAYDKNLTFTTGRCPARSLMAGHLPHLLAVLESFDPTVLFTHRISLDEAPEAYKVFNEQRDGMIKCLLVLGEADGVAIAAPALD